MLQTKMPFFANLLIYRYLNSPPPHLFLCIYFFLFLYFLSDFLHYQFFTYFEL